jgi:Flp pilus assembly pilin Flp
MSARPRRADFPVMAFSRREEGQTMAEYVVVLAVITPIVLLAFAGISDAVLNAINNVRGFL